MTSRKFLAFIILIILIQACGTVKPYYGREFRDWENHSLPDKEKLLHTVYLLGDGGELDAISVCDVVSKMLKEEPDSSSTIAWMGDNIYYDGMPEPDDSDREEKEEVILRQMRVSDTTFTGNTIFIPGNHDWNLSHDGGLEAVKRQEEFIEEYFDGRDVFLPSNGCAGPVVLDVNESLTIIVVDTEWWSHKYEKSRYPDEGCTVEDRIDLIVQLEDAVRSNQNKNIIIMGHHPIMSNSNHGGHYNLGDNIFPLRLVRDNLMIPLPVIGSLYPLLRKLGVSPQDIPSPEGQQWKNAILSIAEHRPNVIYAAGHDHNIQLHRYNQMHHIISGSASKTTYAARGFGAGYVQQERGFCRLLYYDDGQVWVEYFIVNDEFPEGKVTLRTPLYSFKPPEVKPYDYANVPDYRDSIKTIAAGPHYEISKIGKFFMGRHYRNEWITPVTVPYIDIKSFSGGLEPVKKGGGKQTLSLRLLNEDSIQFVLRSVDKFPAKAIPEEFRNTWLNDFIKDQISTAHPYGALTIPKMADAIDIYYTRPILVYTPYTPYLEQYMNQFGGMLSMVEIRPDEDLSMFSRFGNSENVIGSDNMFQHLREDNDNEIDQELFLKSRLFDMVIGDWDRHEDQWRWAEYKKEKGSLFKPIPRDRDQAYTKYDGVIPWLLSRKWTFRNFVNFEHEIDDVKGLNLVSQNMDRMLLSELSREDWQRIAIQIQVQLSDFVIESAIRDMPPEIFKFSGEEIISKLKSRRDKIVETALQYYDFLSKEAYIVTSDKHERFEIVRHNDDSTTVRIFKTKKEGNIENQLYERVFYTDKTKEIRIFSRGGQDRFYIDGEVNKGIRIRIVGGDGEDEFNVASSISGFGESIFIYDNKKENIFNINRDTQLVLSDDVWVNSFTRSNLYQYDYNGPKLTMEHNVDDGLLLGFGFKMDRNGFRSNPYKATHLFMGYHAFKTNAWRFFYQGQFYNFFGHRWDFRLRTDLLGPDFIFNYFGYGNSTDYEQERDIAYYQVKINSFSIEPTILNRFSGAVTLGFAPTFQKVNIEEEPSNIISESTNSTFLNTGGTAFMGAKVFTEIGMADPGDNPGKGFRWYNEARYQHETGPGSAAFTALASELSFYFTPNFPVRATFAHRFGGSTNIGDFYFYQSRFLGGVSNLRGFRRTRFAGHTSFYNNNEVRLRLFNIRGNLLTGDVGGIAFYDLGRVWSETDESNEWHNSYGPGMYFNLYDLFVISATYGISEEDKLFNFRFGFLF